MNVEKKTPKRPLFIGLAFIGLAGLLALSANLSGFAAGDDELAQGCGGPPEELEQSEAEARGGSSKSRGRKRSRAPYDPCRSGSPSATVFFSAGMDKFEKTVKAPGNARRSRRPTCRHWLQDIAVPYDSGAPGFKPEVSIASYAAATASAEAQTPFKLDQQDCKTYLLEQTIYVKRAGKTTFQILSGFVSRGHWTISSVFPKGVCKAKISGKTLGKFMPPSSGTDRYRVAVSFSLKGKIEPLTIKIAHPPLPHDAGFTLDASRPEPPAPPDAGIMGDAGGGATSIAVNGQVVAWGANSTGEANGVPKEPASVPFPAVVGQLQNVVAIAADDGVSWAAIENGPLWKWGQGYCQGPCNTLAKVPGVTNVTKLSNMFGETYAITADGKAIAISNNNSSITFAGNNSPFIDVAVNHQGLSVFLTADGKVWGSMPGLNGQPNITGAKAVGSSGHGVFAIMDDGSVLAYSGGTDPELGLGPPNEITVVNGMAGPAKVKGVGGVGELANIVAINGSHFHALFLDSAGQVYGAGYSASGQLGIKPGRSNPGMYAYPVKISGLPVIESVTAGSASHSYAVDTQGNVWHWGGGDHIPKIVPGITNAKAVALPYETTSQILVR